MAAEAQGSRERFISGMSHAANTVSVVTTDGPSGRFGVTVSSMSSVSADSSKPTLLVCVHNLSPACSAILENGVFCVNLLRDDQAYIADTFAGRIQPEGGDKFSCAMWATGGTGSPLIADHLVAFDCRLAHSFQVGSHLIFVGHVEDTRIRTGHAPLIYSNRGYGTPQRLDRAAIPSHDETAGSLNIGCFFTFAPNYLPQLVSRLDHEVPGVDVALVVGHQAQVLESLRSGACEMALTYDLQLGQEINMETLGLTRPYALLPAEHELASSSAVSLHDLAELPMILLQRPPSEQYFAGLFRELDLEPNIRFRTPSFEMLRGFVGRGLGYSILITRPATSITYDGSSVVAVRLAEEVPPGRIVLATVSERELSPVAARFAGICRDFFQELSIGADTP